MISNYFIIWGFFSTNHKNIGTLYFIFESLKGVVGTLFSLFIHLQLGYHEKKKLRISAFLKVIKKMIQI